MTASLNSNSSSLEAVSFVKEPEISRIIRYAIYVVLFIAAICGNVAVCIIPCRHKRMRTCTYFLITNLAVSDIGTMLCLPYILIAELQNGTWSLGAAMCKLVNPSLTMFYLVTTNTLVAIAVNRFLVLVFPFRFTFSKAKVGLIILLTWLIAFLCVLPSVGARQLIPLQGNPGETTTYYCGEVFPGNTPEEQMYYHNIYSIFQYTINIALPILITVILYVAIAHNLRKMALSLGRNSLSREKSPGIQENQASLSAPHQSGRKRSIDDFSARRRNQLERKFLRMLAVVVLIFVVCYVPYSTFFLVVIYQPEAVYKWKYLYILYRYIYLLMWFPNAVNPICYGALDDHYTNAIKALLRCTSKSQKNLKDRLGSNSRVGTNTNNKNRCVANKTSTMPRILEEFVKQSAAESSCSRDKEIKGKKRWKVVCL